MSYGSQASAQYAFNPLQKQVISLYNVDRSAGLPVPESEGTFIYVDQADYPVIISFVNAATNVFQSYVARNGLMITAPFKGIFLTHPLLNPGLGFTVQPKLILVTGKNGARLENDLAAPYASMPPAAQTISNTAVLQVFNVFLPPGTRRIEKMEFNFQATTLTSAIWNLQNNRTNVFGYGGIVDQYGNVYSASTPLQGYMPAAQIASGPTVFNMKAAGISVPSYADSIQITLVGTAMAAAGATYEVVLS